MIEMYEVMKSINNFFPLTDKAVSGSFAIVEGQLDLPFLSAGQYYIIEGSDFNDNKVHQYAEDYTALIDEAFTGCITPLSVPSEFVNVCQKIKSYITNDAKNDAYVSESFGGYSYTKGTHANGTLFGWQDAFRAELNVWRKI